MPTTSRQRPRLGLLFDALYNEYASIIVAACSARDCALLRFAGGSLHSLAGYEAQRDRCFELASAQSLDGLGVLSQGTAASVTKDA